MITNVERLTKYMEFGSPLNQAFVIHALNQMAKMTIDNKETVKEQMKGSFVDPDAWIQCATEWQKTSSE